MALHCAFLPGGTSRILPEGEAEPEPAQLTQSSPSLYRFSSRHRITLVTKAAFVHNRDALVPPGRVGCDAELHLPDHDVPVAGSMNCRRYRYALSAATLAGRKN